MDSVLAEGEKLEEFCIVPSGVFYASGHIYRWFDKREPGLVRHEIFFGRANRQKSIAHGLVVFLAPQDHNMSMYGVHNFKGHEFDEHLKQLGQKVAMQYYGWSVDDFREKFGKNYL